MKQAVIIAIVLLVFLGQTTTTLAEAEKAIYTTGEELSKALIFETNDGGGLTPKEEIYLSENASKEAIAELAETAMAEAQAFLAQDNFILADEECMSVEYMLDCGATCTITLSDEENPSLISRIGERLFEKASANTTPETMWKEYGDRKFTAGVDIAFIGGITMKEVIYYRVSESGITVTNHEAFDYPPWGLYRIAKKESVCEDKYAREEGCDVHSAGFFWIYKDVKGFWLPCKVKLVRAKVLLLEIDRKNKKARVYQTCEYENL